MKFTKLSLVAALAVSAAVAGGDIAPVPAPVVEEAPKTTINGKLTAYYYTDDSIVDMFDKESSNLGAAVTLDVTHKFTENIAMNFGAVGFTNLMDDGIFSAIGPYMEGEKTGAFINVANITATFMDTTFILGRQLIDTPMLGGFDWLLAPGAFEAYTIANSSIENLTLVGSYVRTWRPNNTGDNWIDLTDIADGNNWTIGAVYDNKTISGNLWYYNIDAMDYTQVYIDAGYNFEIAKVEAQYVNTDYGVGEDSDAYGIKASATVSGFGLMAAYVNISDAVVGYIGRDGLYTSSWNTLALSQGDTFKVEASGEFGGLAASVSYAYYEYEQFAVLTDDNDGHEIDVILGYDLKDSGVDIISAIDVNLVYSNTNYGANTDDINALEIYANYKF